MLVDGLTLTHDSEIGGLTIEEVTVLPITDLQNGRIVALTQTDGLNTAGIYTYLNSNWIKEGIDPSKLPLAGGTMSGNIVIPTGQHISIADDATEGTQAVNLNTLQSYVANLSWRLEAEARDNVSTTLPTGASCTVDGTHTVANGQRILFTNLSSGNNQIYEASGVGSSISWTVVKDFARADGLPIEGDTILIQNGTVYAGKGYTWNGSQWVQFNGGSSSAAGVGIDVNGNVISVLLGAGIKELPTNDVGVDLYTGGGLFLTENGADASTSAAAQLAVAPGAVTVARLADASKAYDVASGIIGKPTASLVMLKFKLPRAITIPANFAGSQSIAGTAANAQTTFVIAKNGSQCATMVFAASGTVATFSTQAAVSFAVGDILSLTAPASPDSALSDIYFTIAAILA